MAFEVASQSSPEVQLPPDNLLLQHFLSALEVLVQGQYMGGVSSITITNGVYFMRELYDRGATFSVLEDELLPDSIVCTRVRETGEGRWGSINSIPVQTVRQATQSERPMRRHIPYNISMRRSFFYRLHSECLDAVTMAEVFCDEFARIYGGPDMAEQRMYIVGASPN